MVACVLVFYLLKTPRWSFDASVFLANVMCGIFGFPQDVMMMMITNRWWLDIVDGTTEHLEYELEH